MELRIREVDEGAGVGVGPLDGFGWPLLVAQGPTSLVRSVSLSNWPLLVGERKAGRSLFTRLTTKRRRSHPISLIFRFK
ncbi:MAG: hypothetical protein EXS07_13375 [Gemmataceae bacterium]|nr:hypothetical protein [Gemmataceae bacterium]